MPRTWTDSLVRPKQWKKDMRFGAWNVNSLYRVGAIKSVVSKMDLREIGIDWVNLIRLARYRIQGWAFVRR
jgi:hypothetical protein